MGKTKLYSLPKLCICKGDVNKLWFVYYNYRNPVTGAMRRFKVYEGINATTVPAEREALAKAIAKQLTDRLANGYTPYQDISARTAWVDIDVNNLHNILWQVYTDRSATWKRRTRETMKNALNSLSKWLVQVRKQHIPVSHFTYADAEDYLRYLKLVVGNENTTINDRRGHLGTLFNYVCRQMKRAGSIYDNPFLETRKLPESPEGQYPFTAAHCEAIRKELTSTDPQLWLACLFVRYCMMRTTEELPFIKMGDLDIEKMTVKVRKEIAKNNKTQVVDLHPAIVEFMRQMEWLDAPYGDYIFGNEKKPGPVCYGKNNLSGRFTAVRKRMGFSQHYSMYSFKHTGNAELFERNKPLPAIRDQNRHCDIRVTDRYAKQYRFYNDKNIWE